MEEMDFLDLREKKVMKAPLVHSGLMDFVETLALMVVLVYLEISVKLVTQVHFKKFSQTTWVVAYV